MLRELILILLLKREGLVGSDNIIFYLLIEKLMLSFIMIISLSLAKREVGESSLN